MRSLARCMPYRNWNLMNMRDEMERMFDDFGSNDEQREQFWTPTVDIVEEDARLVMTAELPGVDKKDVKISVRDNVLIIEGEKNRTVEEKQDKLYRCERDYGKFSRSFTLPSKVDFDKIEADYKDGILIINLPKIEEAKPRQIAIK